MERHDEEAMPLLSSSSVDFTERNGLRSSSSSYIMVKLLMVTGVSALAAFAYVTHGNRGGSMASASASSPMELVASRINMAKAGSIGYSMLSSNEKYSLFEDFKYSFKREYKTDKEEQLRYQHFQKFLEKVDLRNENERKEGGTAVHGLTIFSDYSEEEFASKYLSYRPAPMNVLSRTPRESSKMAKYTGDLTAVDWSGVLTTPVKDQGECGSCWAFSVTQQMESDSIRMGYLSIDDSLSVQQIVDCDQEAYGIDYTEANFGCDGGNTETAYDYVNTVGGLSLEKHYEYSSYEGYSGSCAARESKFVITVKKYHTLYGEDDMTDYVLSTGPLSVCLDATDWVSYQGGIVSSCSNTANHCVQVVGVDTDTKFWKVRNSWGVDWGEEGYIYLKWGKDMCAITNDPTYSKVKPVVKSAALPQAKRYSSAAQADKHISKGDVKTVTGKKMQSNDKETKKAVSKGSSKGSKKEVPSKESKKEGSRESKKAVEKVSKKNVKTVLAAKKAEKTKEKEEEAKEKGAEEDSRIAFRTTVKKSIL